MKRTMLILRDERGVMTIFMLTMLSLLVLTGLSLMELQQASFRDVQHSHSLTQARFLAQSSLQEARYFAVKVDPSWIGTSTEQVTSRGSFQYTTTRDVPNALYTVVATGYVPNKADKNAATFSFTSKFKHNPIPIGIVILDVSMKDALMVSGSGTLNITAANGRVVVNSNHAAAVSAGGSSTLTVPELSIVGGYTQAGGATITGNIITGADPIPDPLGWVTAPVQADYTVQKASAYTISSGVVTINPGVYVGGISLENSANVTLNPGVYYMKNGGFKMKNSAAVSGSEVIIYNDSTATTDTFDLSSTGAVTLTPPTTGEYAGVLFFQKRGSTQAMKLTANSTTSLTGAFYTRDAGLDITGQGSTTAMGTAYVVKYLKVTGNGEISIVELPEAP